MNSESSKAFILFEQPVSELIRFCLRAEHLFNIVQAFLHKQPSVNVNALSAISAVIDLLALTDRPDIRGKFIKEFLRQRADVERFLHHTQIDQEKLKSVIILLDKHILLLQAHQGKFASVLRDSQFFICLQQHRTTMGGILSFDIPAFFYWLQESHQVQSDQISTWLKAFQDLLEIVQLMLEIVRQSAEPLLQKAEAGFFQSSLDMPFTCQLIRIFIHKSLSIYPEVSIGRHGVGIRFYYLLTEKYPVSVLYEKKFTFYLAKCGL